MQKKGSIWIYLRDWNRLLSTPDIPACRELAFFDQGGAFAAGSVVLPTFAPGILLTVQGLSRLLFAHRAIQCGFRYIVQRLKSIHYFPGQQLAGEVLNIRQQIHLIGADQGDGGASGTGTTSAANTVDIVLRYIGQVEVDHLGQLLNIQTPCCNIGGHQNTNFTGLKSGQRPGASTLLLLP